MTERRFTERELETALRDVGAHLSYPASADLVPAVRARIAGERREGFWSTFWSPRAAFVPALATVALLLVATIAFQPIGATAAEALGLGRLAIFRAAETPAATNGKAVLADAQRVAGVEEASRQAGFTVLVPAALGRPDEVYVRRTPQGPTVFLVYGPRSGIAPSKQAGIGVLITEAPGAFEAPLLGKVLPPGARSEQLTVNGGRGVWIEGAPHQIFFRAPNGEVVIDSLRLAGNVLAWDQKAVFVRLEADVTRDEALRIAASVR
ncbi:MAG: hypothetical protein HYU87_04340 [Chloroflexi bacterium]|nr:hypothetical protein [Chloroflexota bacterium]